MKRLTIFLVIIGSIVYALNSFNKQEEFRASSSPSPIPVNTRQQVSIDVDGVAMRISWVEVDPRKLELYSNLTDKKTTSMIQKEKNCETLVNGGFYSRENKHLGLLISNSQTISHVQQNSLFNGFLSIDSSALISTSPPATEVSQALQSGPLIMVSGKPRKLSIKNDEQARRIAAATTNDGKLLFLAIYREGSEFQGPYLEELPSILEKFNLNSKFNMNSTLRVQNSINLDGGSASTFNTDFVNLPERTLVGSYFCLR